MKKLAILLIAIGGLLSGCIPVPYPYEGPSRGGGERHGDRDRDGGNRMDRDRHLDGVANRQDSGPNESRRY